MDNAKNKTTLTQINAILVSTVDPETSLSSYSIHLEDPTSDRYILLTSLNEEQVKRLHLR